MFRAQSWQTGFTSIRSSHSPGLYDRQQRVTSVSFVSDFAFSLEKATCRSLLQRLTLLLADRSSGELCSHRAEQERNQEGIGETRGRRQKAEVISRAETRQAGRGSTTGDQSGENTLEVRHNTRQSGTEAETGAGLNAARAVTGVESWPDEEVWLTGRVEQRQPAEALPFVHTVRRYYRLDGLVRSSDRLTGTTEQRPHAAHIILQRTSSPHIILRRHHPAAHIVLRRTSSCGTSSPHIILRRTSKEEGWT
ncbi:unnamed protein product [Pleuronectes platessa]|uniref:Uncharacterized protein n=1 Tax=Pleuronectes platessa TaxID=8262 RepID=A0A9N7TSA9_PLEPL|nr:unnamed protein product [Pleuronectes platessa]